MLITFDYFFGDNLMKTKLLAVALLAGAFILPQSAFAADEAETYYGSVTFPAMDGDQDANFDSGKINVGNYKYAFTFTIGLDSDFSALFNSTVLKTGTGNQIKSWNLEKESNSGDISLASGLANATTTTSGKTYDFDTGIIVLSAGTYEFEILGTVFKAKSGYTGNIFVTAPPHAVPEPEQFGMFLLGLPLISLLARRKQAA